MRKRGEDEIIIKKVKEKKSGNINSFKG